MAKIDYKNFQESAICSAGKSFLINPNMLFGQEASDNLFVPPEDLNIYVELTTSKKSRSVLDLTDDGFVGTSTEKGKGKVSFIDGSPNGEAKTDKNGNPLKDENGNPIIGKSLTTSYTELTTVFNKTADTEKFGISSIDIDFNSSYAPLVHIEFVDIRGASLFNAGDPPRSEYSGFFDLPYPIFELKVKGYYGKTVKYCLHLTSWNARFNAKTGNFEISADFIGYTYAMLSDMLLGYLRAITKTDKGRAKFDEIRNSMANQNELITINELLNRIVDVNEAITKLQDKDEDIQELATNNEIQKAIDGVENLLKAGIDSITEPNSSQKQGYGIIDTNDGIVGVRNSKEDVQQNKDNVADLSNWKDAMTSQVDKLNDNINKATKYDIDDFTDVKFKENFNYIEITTGTTATNTKQLNFRNEWDLKDDEKWKEFLNRILSIKDSRVKATSNMNLYDFTKTYDKIKEIKDSLKNDEEKIKTAVGQKLRSTFKDTIGFEPTIRNIFRIFTVHSEIFMECLKDVSIKAEKDETELRLGELKKFKDKFDIHKKDAKKGTLPSKIWPWPLFRTPSELEGKSGALEEDYLGGDNGVEIPQNVPELVFVEELLVALLEVGREDIERQERIDNPNSIVGSWFPVNVLDTPLFGVTQNPYKTETIGNSNNPLDPLKLMMMRAFTFLGASNRFPLAIESETMGTLEANTCMEGVQNDIVRKAMLGDASLSDAAIATNIIEAFRVGKNKDRNLVLKDANPTAARPFLYSKGDYYQYKFISDDPSGDGGKAGKYIPFTGSFDGQEFYDAENGGTPRPITYPNSFPDVGVGGNVWLSTNKRDGSKDNHGETLMKIFTEAEYNNDAKALRPLYTEQVDKIQTMISTLKETATPLLDTGTLYTNDRTIENEVLGWNILGDETAKYAFTTVKYIDISNGENVGGKEESQWSLKSNEQGGAELKSAFYVNQKGRFGATSLARKPTEKSELELGAFKGTRTNTTNIEYYPIRNQTGARAFSTNTPETRYPQLGETRDLWNEEDVCIPHVDFIMSQRDSAFGTGDNRYQVFSLFGSKWYFEQRQSSSPKAARALLYLHTHPWNQLYTDNTTSAGGDGGRYASIFDNDEGYTISNLFDRKSAFLNVPYLWCAFIGGMLWRYNDNDIIYEDDKSFSSGGDWSGKVPTFKGGSGAHDPIIWGDRVNRAVPNSDYTYAYLSDFNIAWPDGVPYDKFPDTHQYLTSWTADGPLELDTDGLYKLVSETLINLPVQIKWEFRRVFFEFVNSEEWEQIREAFEVHPKEWDKPDALTGTESYDVNGFNNRTWTWGSAQWEDKWLSVAKLTETSSGNLSAADSLYIGASTTKEVATISPKSGVQTGTRTISVPGKINGVKKSEIDFFRNVKNKNFEYLEPIRKRLYASGRLTEADVYKRITLYDYDLALSSNDANDTMVELMRRGVWIANASYKSWVQYSTSNKGGAKTQDPIANEFAVEKKDLEVYVQAFVSEWKRLNDLDTIANEENALKQQLFNTMDNDTIRLNIYRHCKSLYDKWIAGSGGNIMTSCGGNKKNIDNALSSKDGRGTPRLIDSFRFVNRGFNDIGDKFLLNPKIINDIVIGNMNQSFYDLISRVLADNNFNFIALPAYIDYHSEDEMKALFKPQIYSQVLADQVSGPTFVCVYVGQSSNKLDLGNQSDFPNDGFDFKCDENGNLFMGEGGLPLDFTNQKKPYENNVVAFAVNYGHENQNIFEDIKLDQKEFAETDESLRITDAIAKGGSQSDRTQAGQNLWNVYQVRSYSSEVTMLGNPMIQPMMYYQLNNIPMFHGAYMIINTKHKISPNHMKTTFKGVRTRYTDTKLIDSETLYMSMLGTLSDVDGAGAGYTPGSPKIGKAGTTNSINSQITDNSGGLYITTSGGKTYVWDKSNGFAGSTLRAFMADLSAHLESKHPEKKIKLSSNGVTRDLDSTTKGGASRSTTSKHGCGLAIDMIFKGVYNGVELGNPYDSSATGCKKTKVKCYGWSSGNKTVSNDVEVMKTIRNYVDTNSKWKNVIKWGADFGGNGKLGRVKIAGFPNKGQARIDELHHFEIKDGILDDYIPAEAKAALEAEGLKIPIVQSDLAAIYAHPYTVGENEVATETKNLEENDTAGDAVDTDTQT